MLYLGTDTSSPASSNLLVGTSEVTYNPHFEFFASPNPRDEDFVAVQDWKHEKALLLLDSIEP